MTKKTKTATNTARKETPFTNTGKAIKRKDMVIITGDTEYTAFKNYRFVTATTMECFNWQSSDFSSFLRYGDHVIFTVYNCKGEALAAIYEFAEKPCDYVDATECRIELVELADAVFEDAGHAASWALKRISHKKFRVQI